VRFKRANPVAAAQEVFSQAADREYASEYLTVLRENWREASTAMGRCAILIILSIITFELLARGAIEKASFAGLELKDLSLVRKALPVLTAYLYYDWIVLWIRVGDVQAVHAVILEGLRPKIAEKDLNLFLEPRLQSFFVTIQLADGCSRRHAH
jgi:hypothetical protein